jgi:hypothetical protein
MSSYTPIISQGYVEVHDVEPHKKFIRDIVKTVFPMKADEAKTRHADTLSEWVPQREKVTTELASLTQALEQAQSRLARLEAQSDDNILTPGSDELSASLEVQLAITRKKINALTEKEGEARAKLEKVNKQLAYAENEIAAAEVDDVTSQFLNDINVELQAVRDAQKEQHRIVSAIIRRVMSTKLPIDDERNRTRRHDHGNRLIEHLEQCVIEDIRKNAKELRTL